MSRAGCTASSGRPTSAEPPETGDTVTGQTGSMTDQPEVHSPPATEWATFQARDARSMLDFLTNLRFEATAVYANPENPAVVLHAQVDWPEGGGVMFGSNVAGDWSLKLGTAGFYVVTADPEPQHARAVQAGAEIIREPAETDYGSVEFALRDPEGNLWSFGSYRGEPRLA